MEEKEYLTEVFSFSCNLRGELKYIEEVKKYIMREYVNKGHINLTDPTYDKKALHILTENQWKEYKRLKKNKEENLIGAGFP